MSRQSNYIIENSVIIGGEIEMLISPTNIDELAKAIQLRNYIELEISAQMNDEDGTELQNCLEKQEKYIKEYVDSLGEYSNTIFIKNLNYILRKYSLRIGDLEKNIGISAGYISRTLNEKSGKRLSIDVLWKIARFFNTDIKTLVSIDMSGPNTNSKMSEKFLDKLIQQTIKGELSWDNHGGCATYLDERYVKLGLVNENDTNEEGLSIYHPRRLNPNIKWVISRDILAIKNFNRNKSLAMIPFTYSGSKDTIFDFILIWTDEDGNHKEHVFSTHDSPFAFSILEEKADELYNNAFACCEDIQMTKEIRTMISDYLDDGI